MDFVNEKHFDKLEKKVEKLEDKVDSLKEDVSVLSTDIKHYAEQVKFHVAGDNKIINEVLPTLKELNLLMPELKQIVLERKSDEIQELKVDKQKNSLKTNLAIVSTVITVISGIVALIIKFL